MRFRKAILVSSLAIMFSAPPVVPAFADPPGWAPAHGYRKHHDDRDWHDRDWHDRKHYRNHHRHGGRHYRDRDYDRRTNFQLIIRQNYGPGYGYDYGYAPVYRPYRRPPPDVYYGPNNSNLLGTLLGGAVGGIAGSHIGDGDGRTAAIIGGTMIGALFGGNLGRSMSPYDHVHAANVFEAAPSSRTIAWQNPDNGAAYQLTPTRTYQLDSGQYCREYQAVARVGGRPQSTYGTACRTPDGDWQIMN